MNKARAAKYRIGQIVRHRVYPFRGVVFAENAESEYIAYVSEQNLLPDNSGEPIRHPQVAEVFEPDGDGSFKPRNTQLN